MAYEFTFTPRFQKHFKGLTAQEKKQLKNRLELLAQNPSHPSLRTKRIQGTTDLFECSVNMDIRIIWYYEGDRMSLYEFLRPFFYAASRRINTSEFQSPLWSCLWAIFIKNNWSLSCLRKSSLFILRKSKRFNHFFRHSISIYHNTAPFQNLLQIWQILIS